jgi:predicted nuclease of predicted toxin-antitoxin system
MKLLLDECLPKKLKHRFVGHECRTVSEANLKGKLNGELLTLAEGSGFDVLITSDKGLEYEQNYSGRRISVIILRSKSNRLPELLPLTADCMDVLSSIGPGKVVKIGSR